MSAILTDAALPGVARVEPAAGDDLRQYGVLPWRVGRKGDLRILLVTGRGRPGWGVPGGLPVEGRAPFMSAALDAFEEAGIIGDIDPRPLADYRYPRPGDDGTARRCRVTVFAMRVRGTLSHWKERGERQRRWFAAAEAADVMEHAELAGIVRQLASRPQAPMDAAGRLSLSIGAP